MKLTLRTLLAFLDGTMNEDDSASMRKKIRESDAIKELIQRIRHVVSQPQLPAPKSTMKGMSGDPNHSSEYIDSTLDVERVAEFEKMTIGSDMLLAEVAEAHQILASLGDIDEGVSGRLRNRLYKTTEAIYKSENDEPEMFPVVEDHSSIREDYVDVDVAQKKTEEHFELAPPRTDAPDQDTSGNFGDVPPVQAPPVVDDPVKRSSTDKDGSQTSVPEEKNNKERKNKPKTSSAPAATSTKPAIAKTETHQTTTAPRAKLFPVILATACITALTVLLVVSFVYRPNERVADQNENAGQNDNNNVESDEGNSSVSKQSDSQNSTDQSAEKSDSVTDHSDAVAKNEDGTSQPEYSPETSQTNEGQKTELVQRNLTGPKNQIPGKEERAEGDVKTGSIPIPTKDKDPTVTKDKAKEKTEEVLNLFRDKDYGDGKKSNPDKSSAMEKGKASAEKSKDVLKAEDRKAPPRLTDTKLLMANAASLANGAPIGVFKTALQPTIRRTDLEEAQWINLAQEKQIYINDTVAALPDCQSRLEILDSVGVQLYGFCQVEFKSNEGKILPLVVVKNGVVTFDNLKDPNNTIDVLVGGKKWQVTFVDKNSQFTVVTSRLAITGAPPLVVQLAATAGRILCKSGSEVISLDPDQMLSLEGDRFETRGFKTKPEIVTRQDNSLTLTSQKYFFALGLENPLFDSTVEKALSDSRPYVRKFAVNSSLANGNFKSLIKFLSDEENRIFWRDVFLFARERMQNDDQFRKIAEQACGMGDFAAEEGDADRIQWKTPEQGKTFFRFLSVTSDEELKSGLATKLVDELQNDELLMRVAAIQTLYALTGKTKFFRAEDREDKRRKWVKAWEKTLEAGEIRMTTPFQIQKFD